MRDAAGLPGLSAELALWRLLAARGTSVPLTQVRERLAGDDSPASIQATLAQYDVAARAVWIERTEALSALELPTLLELREGGWIVLRLLKRGVATVEDAQGVRRVALAALWPRLSGQALEFSLRLPDGAGLWARLVLLLGAHRRVLVQFALASVALQLLVASTPELTGLAMGRALPDGALGLLQLVAAGVLAAAVVSGLIAWLRERTVLYLLTRVEVILKQGVLEHVLRLPFAELQRRTLGQLMQTFYGITSARTLVAERALGALFDGVLAIGFLLLMAVKLPQPTLALVLVAVLMLLVAAFVGRAQARLQLDEVSAQASQRGYLTELIAGISTIKAAGAERPCQRQWLDRFDRELALTLRRNRVGLWSEVGLQTGRSAASMGLLLWGGHAALQGEVGIGTLFSFLLLAECFLTAFMGMLSTLLLLVVASRQLTGAVEVLQLAPLPVAHGAAKRRVPGPIEMKDVWFRYAADGPWVLQGYELRVEAGEKFRLEGPSGCGKSTILRLLAGLYVPERGTISVGGYEVRPGSPPGLYLPQFVQLNAGSILDNLRSLSGGASVERLFEAAQVTGFDPFARSLAMGYHTPLPHGGRTLSGGQRQLLALTAALASEGSVLLLDEPMANIDPVTQAHLAELVARESRTIVSVSHG
jgi:ATP-binding cassette subfamily B protein